MAPDFFLERCGANIERQLQRNIRPAQVMQQRMQELSAQGMAVEAQVRLADGSVLTWFNDPRHLHGVRVEFVDDADRPTYEQFMKTGEFDGEMRL